MFVQDILMAFIQTLSKWQIDSVSAEIVVDCIRGKNDDVTSAISLKVKKNGA